MQIIRYLLIVSVALLIILYPKAKKYDIEVVVSNINTQQGNIELAVFDKSEVFLQKDKSIRKYSKPVIGNSIIIKVEDLPEGHYAVSLYHDVNGDKECNLNVIGIPKEPYGFSNNFKPLIRQPNFEDCHFFVSENQEIHISLIGK
ncbi:MAG: DUF2141 domain-containing protein [Flavobacteriales bacterium]|nr:DUF2141 domain-containing protein [Flavobacteriales bacterium]